MFVCVECDARLTGCACECVDTAILFRRVVHVQASMRVDFCCCAL